MTAYDFKNKKPPTFLRFHGSDAFSPGSQSKEQPVISLPLAVDLDGTLVTTDLLVISLLRLIKQRLSLHLFFLSGYSKGKPFKTTN